MSRTTSKPMSLRIYLIRHGETEWSRSGQYTGRTDLPLTALGEDAARDLGQRLRNIPFAHVLTSPLQRAHQTCALAGLTPVAEIEADLAEWDNGDYEGRTPANILGSRPGWNLFRDGPPNGETPAQISTRADRFIARLRVLDGNVALFSHGHFGRVLAARWIGLSVEQAQHLLLNTASLSVLCYEHERTDQPAIALWNSAAHETFDPAPNQDAGDTRPMKQRAIQRWENEGGEIPNEQRNQTGGQKQGEQKRNGASAASFAARRPAESVCCGGETSSIKKFIPSKPKQPKAPGRRPGPPKPSPGPYNPHSPKRPGKR